MTFQSGVTGLRPRRSSIATSFSSPGSERPSSRSLSRGTVRNGRPVFSQAATTRRISVASSDGMAMTRSLAAVSGAIRATSSIRPRTGRPCR